MEGLCLSMVREARNKFMYKYKIHIRVNCEQSFARRLLKCALKLINMSQINPVLIFVKYAITTQLYLFLVEDCSNFPLISSVSRKVRRNFKKAII